MRESRTSGSVRAKVSNDMSYSTSIGYARNLVLDHFGAESLASDKQAKRVFYCSNPMCRKAPIAARRAVQFGFTNVRVLVAGISGWRDVGLPVGTG